MCTSEGLEGISYACVSRSSIHRRAGFDAPRPQAQMRNDRCALQNGTVRCHLSPNLHPAICPSLRQLLTTRLRPMQRKIYTFTPPQRRKMDKRQDTEVWPNQSGISESKEHHDVSIKRDGAEEEAMLERTTRVRRVFSFAQFFASSLAYMGAWEGVCV